MKLIYLAHPFGGEMKNVDRVQKIITELIHKHPVCGRRLEAKYE